MGKVKQEKQVVVDGQPCDILEGKASVGDNRLELHTQLFDFCGDLIKIRSPEQCLVGMLDHQIGYIPYLRHDTVAHHVIDSLIVIVLLRREQSGILHGLAVHPFCKEDASRGDLCRGVLVKDILDGLSAHFLCAPLSSKGSEHRSSGLYVHIHTIVLGSCAKSRTQQDGENEDNLLHKRFLYFHIIIFIYFCNILFSYFAFAEVVAARGPDFLGGRLRTLFSASTLRAKSRVFAMPLRCRSRTKASMACWWLHFISRL